MSGMERRIFSGGSGSGGSGSSLPSTAVPATGNVTAANGQVIEANASGGAFTVTSIPTPSVGNAFAVFKTEASANAVAVSGTVMGDAGGASIASPEMGGVFIYVGGSIGWYFVLIGSGGSNGTNGNSVLSGAGAPSAGTGVNGDFYIDTTAHAIYGPKAGGAWGSGTSLVGPTGSSGTNGAISSIQVNGTGQTVEPILDLIAGTNVTLTPANDAPGTRTTVTIAASGGGSGVTNLFGDGSDGALTLDGSTNPAAAIFSTSGSAPNLVYTLLRDVFATTLTINAGATLKPANYAIFASTSVTNNGTIDFSGAAPTGGNGQTRATAASSARFVLGAGANGGTGVGANGSGAGYLTANGGNGGSGTSGAGGTGATGTKALSTNPWMLRTAVPVFNGSFFWANASFAAQFAGGGGSGAGDGTNSGGAGGLAGGTIAIFAPAVTNSGTISANGGAGGSPVTGNCGGGGGGGGGLIAVYTASAWTPGTTSANAGTHGTGVGTGANGTDGAAGLVLNVVV